MQDLQNSSRNRGFAFIEYYNHACADYARQKMSKADFRLGDKSPTVSWADPSPKSSNAESSAVSEVFYPVAFPGKSNLIFKRPANRFWNT